MKKRELKILIFHESFKGGRAMKRVLTLLLCGMLIVGGANVSTHAASLDDIIAGSQSTTVQESQSTPESQESTAPTTNSSSTSNVQSTQDYLDQLNRATEVSTEESAIVTKINSKLSKGIGMFIQFASYAIIALLAASVVIDIAYLSIPFSRTLLAHGHVGVPKAPKPGQQPGAQPGMQPGMQSGFGMNGMSSSGMYGGMNRYGAGGMGAYGTGGMQSGMPGQQPQPQGGGLWLASEDALNAVASQQAGMGNAFRLYAQSAMVKLVATPILLVLAVSGVLTKLGLLLGQVIASGISALGNMM
jgi:hypothetical protein